MSKRLTRSASKAQEEREKKAQAASSSSLVVEYIIATRPWTFTAAIMPILVVGVVKRVSFSYPPFLYALFSGIVVQAASNLTNTYFDFVTGRDTKKDSGDRALVDRRQITPQGVVSLALILYGLSVIFVATAVEPSRYKDLVGVFFTGALLSYFYTAHPFSLKCKALGDVVIFVCFGPLLTQFTALLIDPKAGSSIHWEVLPHTIPLGLLTECILHANNARDIEMDKKGGMITVAGMLGFQRSRLLFIIMIILSYLTSIYLATTSHKGNALVILTIPIAISTIRKFQEKSMNEMPENVAKLHMAYGLLNVVGIALLG